MHRPVFSLASHQIVASVGPLLALQRLWRHRLHLKHLGEHRGLEVQVQLRGVQKRRVTKTTSSERFVCRHTRNSSHALTLRICDSACLNFCAIPRVLEVRRLALVPLELSTAMKRSAAQHEQGPRRT